MKIVETKNHLWDVEKKWPKRRAARSFAHASHGTAKIDSCQFHFVRVSIFILWNFFLFFLSFSLVWVLDVCDFRQCMCLGIRLFVVGVYFCFMFCLVVEPCTQTLFGCLSLSLFPIPSVFFFLCTTQTMKTQNGLCTTSPNRLCVQ